MTYNVVHLDRSLYPSSAIEQALNAYSGFAAVAIVRQTSDKVVIEIRAESQAAIDEFLNFALMASLELLLASV